MDEKAGLDAREVLDAVNELLDSPGWALLREDLKMRFARLDRALHTVGDTATIAEFRFLQGQLDSIRWLIERPENRMREIRADLARTQ